jgi:hypothetical protein
LGDADFMFTVAEVAVALAGFAGLVSIVSQRLDGRNVDLGSHRLRLMLLYSLTVTGFSLVPYLLLRAGVAEVSSWRLCSAAFFMVWLAIFAPAFPRATSFAHGAPLTLRLWAYVGIAVSVVGLTVLALNTLGVFGSRAGVAYMTALLILLFGAARLFFRLFKSLVRPDV